MKKVTFGSKRPSGSPNGAVDDWVLDRAAPEREPMKRFTIDVPVSLHKRVKSQCAMQNLVMADVMRDLLERQFPPLSESERGGPS
jgi:hypothetical protein